MESAERSRQQCKEQTERAKAAEMAVLHMRLKTARQIVEAYQKEAIFHQQRLGTYKQKYVTSCFLYNKKYKGLYK